MYHDQLKHLPSGLSGSLKYGVDTVLPEVMSQQVMTLFGHATREGSGETAEMCRLT